MSADTSIGEACEKRKNLSKKVAYLLRDFEKSTGTKITNASICRSSSLGSFGSIHHVALDVELPEHLEY